MHQPEKQILIIDGISEELDKELSTTGYKCFYTYNFQDAINKILNKNTYDLVIIDTKVSRLRIWKLLEVIRTSEFTSKVPVIVIFSQSNINDKTFAINLGADDVLCRPYNPQELLIKIKALLRRSEWNKIADVNFSFDYTNSRNLSERQLEILSLASQGYSNKEIANILSLSEKTIKTHLHTIFEKLSVKSRTQAIIVALKEGLAS